METPNRSSKKRKTMTGGTLESPIGVINPMRRSSIGAVTSTPAILQANDDEEERRNWKRMSTLPQEPETRASPSIPLNTLEEYMGIWVRMSVENKINAKNVWKIHIIDYLRTLLDKEIDNPLQIGTASLSASAKVYSLRIDDVYNEVIKLSGGLGRRAPDENDEERGADAASDDENSAEHGNKVARIKKKKKGKKKTTANPETLMGDIDVLDMNHPLFAQLNARNGDIIGTDNMFQVFIPINSKTSEFDIRIHEKFVDDTASKRLDTGAMEVDENVKRIKLPFELEPPSAIKDLQTCPTFAEFSLTNWSLENEEQTQNHVQNQTILPSTSEQINLAFDMDAEPQAIMDVSMQSIDDNARNYSSDEEIVQDVITEPNHPIPSAGCKPHIENIVDMRPSNPNTTRNLEYSYNLIASGIWAGPSHWKIKSIIHRAQPRVATQTNADAEANKRKRKTKTNLLNANLTYDDVSIDENTILTKPFLKCGENKLKMPTITSWNKSKNELPVDLHITVADCLKLFLNVKRSLVPDERPASNLSIENNQYDYNNLNDSAFCNPPNPELLEEHNGSDHDYGDNDVDQGEAFTSMDHGQTIPTEGEGEILTGDNLLSAPRVIPKTFVPYATRAKKVNMKTIKNSMWTLITEAIPDAAEPNENSNQVETVRNIEQQPKETNLSTVLEKLPSMLPRDQAANISPALAFFGLLHLANENNLILEGNDSLSDITINRE